MKAQLCEWRVQVLYLDLVDGAESYDVLGCSDYRAARQLFEFASEMGGVGSVEMVDHAGRVVFTKGYDQGMVYVPSQPGAYVWSDELEALVRAPERESLYTLWRIRDPRLLRPAMVPLIRIKPHTVAQ